MTLTTLGRVNQPTPGTPIQLSTNSAQRVARLFFQTVPGLTGKGYVGTSGFNKSTLAGVARVLTPSASGPSDQFLIETDSGYDQLNLSEYFFDMDNAGEGLIVSYWIE